jgi:hypothetical protein
VAALLALSVERFFRSLQLLGWDVAALLALSVERFFSRARPLLRSA